ncbi:hypothetical protein M3J09_008342 [Ascochyta lentis]
MWLPAATDQDRHRRVQTRTCDCQPEKQRERVIGAPEPREEHVLQQVLYMRERPATCCSDSAPCETSEQMRCQCDPKLLRLDNLGGAVRVLQVHIDITKELLSAIVLHGESGNKIGVSFAKDQSNEIFLHPGQPDISHS